jgi:hypothetical protein
MDTTTVGSICSYSRLLGPCYKTGRIAQLFYGQYCNSLKTPPLGRILVSQRFTTWKSLLWVTILILTIPFHYNVIRYSHHKSNSSLQLLGDSLINCTLRLDFYNFKFYFTHLSMSFSPFLHSTCSLSVFYFIISLGRNLSPIFTLHYQAMLLSEKDSIRPIECIQGTFTLYGPLKVMLVEH